jgi:hypothetical protein
MHWRHCTGTLTDLSNAFGALDAGAANQANFQVPI